MCQHAQAESDYLVARDRATIQKGREAFAKGEPRKPGEHTWGSDEHLFNAGWDGAQAAQA